MRLRYEMGPLSFLSIYSVSSAAVRFPLFFQGVSDSFLVFRPLPDRSASPSSGEISSFLLS